MVDLLEAVQSTIVHSLSFLLTGSHHESSSHGIEWVGDNTSTNGDDLSETPHGEEVSLLDVFEEHNLTSIEHTEIGGSVGDDTNDGDTETSVESTNTVFGGALSEAVNETIELSLSTGSNIGGKSGSGEIEWVDNAKGSSTGSTTRGTVTNEELQWLFLWVVWAEPLLVSILTGEVKSLSWEVTDNIGEVTSPEGTDTLLSDDSLEAISDTVISHLLWDIWVGILDLKEELDSLDWGDSGLGDSSGNTTDEEILDETLLLNLLWFLSAHIYLSILLFIKLINDKF